MNVEITTEEPHSPDVLDLLGRHLEFARATSPRHLVFAMDVEALADPSVTLCGVREPGGTLLAVGALKELDPTHGEIKSMHTAEAARGRGIGALLLDHLLDLARQRGYGRVSLETGTMEAFAPARRLYERAGFAPTEPFGDYPVSEHSVCMTLELG